MSIILKEFIVKLVPAKESKIFGEDDGTLTYHEKGSKCDGIGTPLQLYILSDDKIESGNHYYNDFHNKVFKSWNGDLYDGNNLKVIATTNTKLYDIDSCNTDVNELKSYPSPTDEWVKWYCANPKDKVKVEWEYEPSKTLGVSGDFTTREIDRLKVISGNYINILSTKDISKDPKYLGIPNINFSLTKDGDKREEKFSKQRLERGFDDSETWSLSGTLAKFLLPRLNRFNELDCFERDDEYREDMANFISLLELENRDNGARIFTKEEDVTIDKGLDAFKRIFFRLWW